MSKRIKIKRTEGTPIDSKALAESKKRISDAMKPIIKDFKRKEAQSIKDAKNLIINT